MENTKEIVATLKAQSVNAYEFTKPRGYRSNDLYESDFDAEVMVKVGNAVKDIKLRIHRDYVSSTGEYNTPTYVDSHYTPYAPQVYRNSFSELKEAGIEIDFSDVLAEYQAEVWIAKATQKKAKATRKAKAKAERREGYHTSWPFKFVEVIAKDPNKKIKAANFRLSTPGKFDFIHRGESFVQVTYKGIVGYISREDGRYIFKDGRGTEKNERGYFETFAVTDGKVRRAKREGTTLLKFLEAVDEYFAIREARKTRAQKQKEARAEFKKKLEKLAGYPVVEFMETRYRKNNRGMNQYDQEYKEYSYKIVTKQPDSHYGSAEGLKISENTYNGETYSINGLGGLSKKEFKAILTILLENKEVFAKVVTPKRPE